MWTSRGTLIYCQPLPAQTCKVQAAPRSGRPVLRKFGLGGAGAGRRCLSRSSRSSHAAAASRAAASTQCGEGSSKIFLIDMITMRSCGLMDKALVFGTKDCRFESCQDHIFFCC